MKKTNQIITIHLGVLVLYTLFFAIWTDGSGPYRWMGFMILQAIMMVGHGVSTQILALTQSPDKPEYSKAHWLGLGLMLLIGGSICFITPGLFEKNFY